MTNQDTAAELGAAADKLRQLVAAISPPNPVAARFHADDRHVTQGDHGLYDVATAETPECATFIAAMDPPVALALADWLGCLAMLDPTERDAETCGWCGANHPAAVARALTTT